MARSSEGAVEGGSCSGGMTADQWLLSQRIMRTFRASRAARGVMRRPAARMASSSMSVMWRAEPMVAAPPGSAMIAATLRHMYAAAA